MGRSRLELGVREVFVFDKNANISKCLICEKNTAGSHHGNLSKHLMRCHSEVYKDIVTTKQPQDEEPVRKKIKVTVEYDPIELLDAWLNIVIEEGRPFCILNSKNLRKIVTPLFNALDIKMIDSSNISAEIKARAEKMRQHIEKILAGKMISIKIDSATRHTRRLVCINAQTILKGKIIIQTLSMTEIHRSHSGINLKAHVLSVLERFNIPLEHIYTYTTDNGKNMVCAGKFLDYPDSEDENSNENEHEQSATEETEEEYDTDDDDTDDDEDDMSNAALFETDDDIFNSELESLQLEGVQVERCACHTLQLGIDDTLNEAPLKHSVTKFRKLAIHLRTPTNTELLKSKKLKKAKRDNETRWNSKYDMVLSLVNLKTFCQVQKIKILDNSDWELCNTFLDVFKPVKVATKLLQDKNLALGDFFKIWLDMTLRIKELTKSSKHTSMASSLHKHLMKREALLFKDNDTLLAALYLDPRFRRVFKKIRPQYFDETKARDHLLSLFKQIKKIEQKIRERKKPQPESETSAESTPSTSKESTSESGPLQNEGSEEESILEKYMEDLFDDESNENDEEKHLEDDIMAAFTAIRNYNDKKPLDTDVIQYWYSKRFSDPTLSKLALILHAVPATQVSVERCFSTLKFILNDYRTNIRSDTLADLMLLKLNA